MDRVLSNAIAGVRDARNERNTRDLDIWASFNQPVWVPNMSSLVVHVGPFGMLTSSIRTSLNIEDGPSMELLATQTTIAFEGQTSLNYCELVVGECGRLSRHICTGV